MPHRIDDLRIQSVRPLIPAAILVEELPLTERAQELVYDTRKGIEACINGEDNRLVVVVGPCSIHDVTAAEEYGARLKAEADRLGDRLLIIMRSYFEKPRTTVGWKGLVNDPYLDGSFKVNEGLRLARRLLVKLAELGLPAGTEFLDTTLPQHLADLISWGAIGARTTESQTHREMASGLSMPIGFKNTTEGSFRTAIDAILAAREPHWFAGATKDGISALLRTIGNNSTHLILRGGSRTGPNYHEPEVTAASEALAKDGLPSRVMIDLSHGNSSKKFQNQLMVAESVIGQLQTARSIFGVMIESNLEEGKQNISSELKYGQSVTDACLGFPDTVLLLDKLAAGVRIE